MSMGIQVKLNINLNKEDAEPEGAPDLNKEKITQLKAKYKAEFMSLKIEGFHKGYWGSPYGIILHSAKKDLYKDFDSFFVSTLKFSKYDDWHEEEVEEECHYIEKRLTEKTIESLKPLSIQEEIKKENHDILKWGDFETLPLVKGFTEEVVNGYKLKLNWDHIPHIAETSNYYIGYHWYTTE